jgi:hypothetical protein
VLVALARALQLDEAEQTHLFDLARTATAYPGARHRSTSPNRVRPSVQRVLDALTAPAWIRNGRADVVATNALGRALYAPLYDDPVRPANTAQIARDMVAVLRAAAGHDPYDKGLTDLVGE